MKHLIVLISLFVALTINAVPLGDAGTVVNKQSLEILNKVSNLYSKSTGTELKLKIGIEDDKTGKSNSTSGVLKTAGNKFNLNTSFAEMVFDGKTLDVFDKQANELTISVPEDDEVSSVDPTAIITMFKEGYKISAPEYDSSGKLATITLYPEEKGADATMIKVTIDTTTSTPTKIKTFGKNGVNQFVEIQKVETNKTFKDEVFQFNADKYPKLQVIDLR